MGVVCKCSCHLTEPRGKRTTTKRREKRSTKKMESTPLTTRTRTGQRLQNNVLLLKTYIMKFWSIWQRVEGAAIGGGVPQLLPSHCRAVEDEVVVALLKRFRSLERRNLL